MPVPDVFLADVALHLLHFAFVRQDDHHGGVAIVGQHDDSGVVVSILIEVISACPLHHVNLNLGVLVHVELCLVSQVTIEGSLPLSCVQQMKRRKQCVSECKLK